MALFFIYVQEQESWQILFAKFLFFAKLFFYIIISKYPGMSGLIQIIAGKKVIFRNGHFQNFKF